MKSGDKNNKPFYITHSGELLIWLIIICVVVAFNSLGYISKEYNRDNDYKIFLQDVDGLIVGSPVRMMGIEVGYVTKIKPLNDEVYVKFILTNPDVYIPQGTSATVEFTGMAGSRFYFVIPVANDKSNFNMIKKQLIQKARSAGGTVAIIKIKASNEVIDNLMKEENLLNKTYMSNSLVEKDGNQALLSMVVVDGDKPSAEFLKKRIDSVVKANEKVYGQCDIMYSYEIEGDMHEKDSYSR